MSFDAADTLLVRFYHTMGSQQAVTARHFRVAGNGGAGSPEQDVADSLSVAYSNLIRPLMSLQASYRGLQIRRITPNPTADWVSVMGAAVGTVAGEALPGQASGLLSLRTALPGKSFRGREYVPFPGESDNQADAKPIAGYLTRLVSLAALWLNNQTYAQVGVPANTTVIRGVIYSKKLGSRSDITTAIARNGWATQRRRGSLNRTDTFAL